MADEYGVTPAGFVKMRLDVIRAAIVADLTARLGKPVQTRPDSIFGELIDTFAEREAALWEMAEGVYNAMYPSSATDDALDRAVEFAGVDRLLDTSTQAYAVIYGVEGTLVPMNSSTIATDTNSTFLLAADTTITANAAADVTVAVPAVLPNTTYVITINSAAYNYTSGSTTALTTIVAGLVAAVLGAGLLITSDGASVRLQTQTQLPFTLAVSTQLAITSLGSPSTFTAEEVGPTPLMAGALTTADPSVPGWTSINNPVAGLPGAYAEDDAELRARYVNGVYGLGAATLPALIANPLNRVVGVTSVSVVENEGSLPDDFGQPAHSVQMVVSGGSDVDVANEIFRIVAAGIDTFGSSSQTVLDAVGTSHVVFFSRPSPIFIWVRCVLTLLPEEVFPGNGLALAATAIYNFGSSLPTGAEVVNQRFYGPIYQSCTGIASINLQFASSTNPLFAPGDADYAQQNVDVLTTQQANFDLSRITVT